MHRLAPESYVATLKLCEGKTFQVLKLGNNVNSSVARHNTTDAATTVFVRQFDPF